jgi:hypothetical protein
VSSPEARGCRGYSEDTQIRAGDNGGYARGYRECFLSLTAWQIPLRARRSVGQAVFFSLSHKPKSKLWHRKI